MEPSATELKAMTKVEDIVAFVPMAEALATTFYKELDIDPGAPLRSLAAIEKEDLLEARANMKVDGASLSATAKGKVVTAWRISRVATGLEKSTSTINEEADLTRKLNEKKLEVLKVQAEVASTSTGQGSNTTDPHRWPGEPWRSVGPDAHRNHTDVERR